MLVRGIAERAHDGGIAQHYGASLPGVPSHALSCQMGPIHCVYGRTDGISHASPAMASRGDRKKTVGIIGRWVSFRIEVADKLKCLGQHALSNHPEIDARHASIDSFYALYKQASPTYAGKHAAMRREK